MTATTEPLPVRLAASPADLPAVASRDLLAAWAACSEAAALAREARPLAIRFQTAEGRTIDFAMRDPDAMCWTAAIARRSGLGSQYGIAVCLRLLAMVDLLAKAPWAAETVTRARGGLTLHPQLLRLAAEMPLSDEARFDEAAFGHRLRIKPGQTGSTTGAGT